jgi:glycine cleavage system aminomethyltransferase T
LKRAERQPWLLAVARRRQRLQLHIALCGSRSISSIEGVSTSRGYSYYFREMLSLCTLDVACCDPGSEVIVIWGNPGGPQKEIRAKVAPAPYKIDNRRLDVHSLPPPKQVTQLWPPA